MSTRGGAVLAIDLDTNSSDEPMEVVEAMVETHKVPKITIPPEALRPVFDAEVDVGAALVANELRKTSKVPPAIYDLPVVAAAIELPYAPPPQFRRFNPDAVTQPSSLGVARRAVLGGRDKRKWVAGVLVLASAAALVEVALAFQPWHWF